MALASIPFLMVAMSAPGEFPEARFKLSPERVFDYFINLAVCNTVVIGNNDGGESASSTTDVSGSPSDSSGVSDVSLFVDGVK